MEIIEAIRGRRSIRFFKPEPVPRKTVEELLETCRWAPSARNTQPWELYVLGGRALDKFKTRLVEMVKAEIKIYPEIPVPDLAELYQQRWIEVRDLIDTTQFPPGTENLEEKRAEYWLKASALFYDASIGIVLCVEKALCPRAIFDAGIMAQTIALAAQGYGLGVCFLGRPIFYPDQLKELLGIPESKMMTVAMAIGYPELEAPINRFSCPRVPLNSFTHWQGL